MTDRMRKLQECLQIAIEKRNPLLEQNIRAAIRDEEASPQYLQTSDNWNH